VLQLEADTIGWRGPGRKRYSANTSVTGYLKAGVNISAAPADTVLHEQLTRLQNYIEHGDPVPH